MVHQTRFRNLLILAVCCVALSVVAAPTGASAESRDLSDGVDFSSHEFVARDPSEEGEFEFGLGGRSEEEHEITEFSRSFESDEHEHEHEARAFGKKPATVAKPKPVAPKPIVAKPPIVKPPVKPAPPTDPVKKAAPPAKPPVKPPPPTVPVKKTNPPVKQTPPAKKTGTTPPATGGSCPVSKPSGKAATAVKQGREVLERTIEALHFWGKRDAVCSQDFRAAFDANGCIGGSNFALTPPSTITATQNVATKPAASQCDHTVEIQFLDGVLKKNNVCAIISALAKVDTTHTGASLLTPMSNTINGNGNLLFLDASVNNRKKSFIVNAVNGKANAADDLNTAVKSFLQLSKARSDVVAATLDTQLTALLATAQQVSDNNKPCGTGRRLSAEDRLKQNLIDALEKKPAAGIIKSSWDKVFA